MPDRSEVDMLIRLLKFMQDNEFNSDSECDSCGSNKKDIYSTMSGQEHWHDCEWLALTNWLKTRISRETASNL